MANGTTGFTAMAQNQAGNRRRSENVQEELEELRRSHAALACRVARLSDQMQAARTSFSFERISFFREKASFEARVLERALSFARAAFLRVILGGNADMNRSYPSLCAANSVKQVLLKSSPTDCTLLEFNLMVTEFLKRDNVKCDVFPSTYYALFMNSEHASHFEIAFETFFDLCEALKVDVVARESGLYREGCNRQRQVRAIQILGVDFVTETSRQRKERRILIGRSMPTSRAGSSSNLVPLLFQGTTAWSEGLPEDGFVFRQESLDSFVTNASLNSEDRRHIPSRMSDVNMPDTKVRKFSLIWERMNQGAHEMGAESERVLGRLRCFIPAVILRSSKLTQTVQTIFSTRVNGRYLKQIVVSPQDPRT